MTLTEHELRSLDYEPDTGGHFGTYGGRYVSETLMAALGELDQNYQKLKNDPDFQKNSMRTWPPSLDVRLHCITRNVGQRPLVEHKFTSSEKI